MSPKTMISPGKEKRPLHTNRPRARSNSKEDDSSCSASTPNRARFNSRDVSRTYAGQYNTAGDLLPLEISRSQQILQSKVSLAVFLSTYVTLLAAIQFGSSLLVSSNSCTVTNGVHLVVTLSYIHWFKGSYLLDAQGELDALTMWEQLEATPESSTYMRRILLIVPTLLTYAACVTANFDATITAINLSIWAVSMLAKLPFMNGVRIFGINRTVGIDDELKKEA